MAMNKYLSTITSNVNGLNTAIKWHRVAEWIRKRDPYICCIQEILFKTKYLHKLKSEEMEKIFHAKEEGKKAGVVLLTSDKINFKTKAIKKVTI